MAMTCAYCGNQAQGKYSVHRDGFFKGPEVPLCDACGDNNETTLHQIWAKIANPEPVIVAIKEVQDAKLLAAEVVNIWKEDHERK